MQEYYEVKKNCNIIKLHLSSEMQKLKLSVVEAKLFLMWS